MVRSRSCPTTFSSMIQAGEKTGKVEDMMDNIADFYDDEIDTMEARVADMQVALRGDRTVRSHSEPTTPGISSRVSRGRRRKHVR